MLNLPKRLWALAVISGLLQIVTFPVNGPAPAWRGAICWIGLVPLLYSLIEKDRANRPVNVLQASFLGYLSGFIFYLGNCFWIFDTMHLYGALPEPVAGGILLLFSLYLGLYHALFSAIVGLLRARWGRAGALAMVPFVWVGVELARARVTGFPWDLLGYAQIDHPLLVYLAPWGGAYSLSFVIAGVNALWLIRIRMRARRFLRPALALLLAVICLGYLLILRKVSRPMRSVATATATLVQENLKVGAESNGPVETRDEMLATFAALSRHPTQHELDGIPEAPGTRMTTVTEFPYVMKPGVAGYQATDLIVWPESPAGFRTDDPSFRAATSELARSMSVPLVIGSLGVVPDATSDRGARLYDSAALVDADGRQAGRYDKIHLVPFGEYIPFKEVIFFARKLTAGVGDMDRGHDRSVFRTAKAGRAGSIGVFICYESIFGDEVRRFVRNGAEVLVNISDDGWYGDSGAPWQHLNMVRMRAIENHRWILRATNTGVTGVIDPEGRVRAALPRHIRSSINVPFGYEQGITFYTLHGDIFAYFCVLATVLALARSPRAHVD